MAEVEPRSFSRFNLENLVGDFVFKLNTRAGASGVHGSTTPYQRCAGIVFQKYQLVSLGITLVILKSLPG